MSEMELLIAESNLAWTLVRPPQLVNSSWEGYEARPDAPPDGDTKLGRRALALFMLAEGIAEGAIRKKLTVLSAFYRQRK